MPAPTITTLPDAPSIADPANFPTKASAHVASLATFVTEINAFGDFVDGSGYTGSIVSTIRSTYGGTANAITLTTGQSLTSVPTGLALRFRATAANTGATTINVDGIGAVAAVTVTGVALPADYIRTGIDTVAIYDGTNWVVYREVEKGSNANGTYTRFADGTMICSHVKSQTGIAITTGSGSLFISGLQGSLTFPAAFTATPRVVAGFVNVSGGVEVAFVAIQQPTATAIGNYRYIAAVSTTTDVSIGYTTNGSWY